MSTSSMSSNPESSNPESPKPQALEPRSAEPRSAEPRPRRSRPRWKRFARAALLSMAAVLVVLATFLAFPVDSEVPPIRERADTRYWHLDGDWHDGDGHRIAYTRVAHTRIAPARVADEASPRSRPPVVYLHGGPGGYIHSTTIEAVGRLAEEGHDVYLYDQVGSGLSDRLPRPKDYHFNGHLEDLREIVENHLGGGPVVLIGQSYGGILAGHFIAHHPELVAAGVLTSPGSLQPIVYDEEGHPVHIDRYPVPRHLDFVDPMETDGWGVGDWPLRAIASVAIAVATNRKLMPDAEADGVLNDIAARITPSMVCDPERVHPEEGGGGFYSHGWSNWYANVEDPRPALATSPVPLLVLQGQCDYLPYAASYEYADLMPRGEYRFVEGAGHALYWDRPAIFAEVVAPFLEETLADG